MDMEKGRELADSRIQHVDRDIEAGRAIALVASLKACAKRKDLDGGSKLHADAVNLRLLESNYHVGSALISMYAKCGALERAQEVFDDLPDCNAVSWNALISGYVQHGQGAEALKCFEEMRLRGITPDRVTLSCILRACGSLGALEKGQEIHTQIISENLFEQDVVVCTALIDMYAKCGALEKAQEVFDKLAIRNVVSWTALIAGYCQDGHSREALYHFDQMNRAGVLPNAVTFACVLKACGSIGALQKGEKILVQIDKMHSLDKNTLVANAAIDMFAKCGALDKAQDVFNGLVVRDVISWNALITGYAQQSNGAEALKYFGLMIANGFAADAITYAGVLKACANIGALEKGQEVHGHIIRECLLGKNILVTNALVDMYAKCSEFQKARELIDEVQIGDVVSWTSLIAGYEQHGYVDEAIGCYEEMLSEGLFPDAITFACLLKACGNSGSVFKGLEIHSNAVKFGLSASVMAVRLALIGMYSNFGLLAEAQDLFSTLPVRDIAAWSALMVGYSQVGMAHVVFELFQTMIELGRKPDSIVFSIILNACNHHGYVEGGVLYFEILSKNYGLLLHPDHYTCMVDSLSRAGHHLEALAVIKEMPLSANLEIWVSLLVNCRKWGNNGLGSWVLMHAIKLIDVDNDVYACLSNIYAASGQHFFARRRQAWNEPDLTQCVDQFSLEEKGLIRKEESR